MFHFKRRDLKPNLLLNTTCDLNSEGLLWFCFLIYMTVFKLLFQFALILYLETNNVHPVESSFWKRVVSLIESDRWSSFKTIKFFSRNGKSLFSNTAVHCFISWSDLKKRNYLSIRSLLINVEHLPVYNCYGSEKSN